MDAQTRRIEELEKEVDLLKRQILMYHDMNAKRTTQILSALKYKGMCLDID